MTRAQKFWWVLLGWAVSAWAGATSLLYQTTIHESRWESSGSRFGCELRHSIAGYGVAVFSQAPGRGLRLHLAAKRQPVRGGDAKLWSLPAPWDHVNQPLQLAALRYQPSAVPVRVVDNMAARVFYELEQGMFPMVRFEGEGYGGVPVEVMLSAVNFRAAVTGFRACRGGLLPYALQDLRRTQVLFPSGQAHLTAAARRRLDAIVAYTLAGRGVQRVVIRGHTDHHGSYRDNHFLSKERALVVQRYLLEQKIPAAQLEISYHGELKPVASNRTATGRARNRRVEIRLF